MSFGFGVGDFIAVGNLAWQVWKSCKEAPESFKNVSQEVLSLHAVLKEIEEVLEGQTLSASREARLATIIKGCSDVLRDLQSLVKKYESLGSKTQRTWDRLKWRSDDIAELRARLTSNTGLLSAFITTSQIIVERQLNKFMHEFKDGKHEPSVITTMTVESLSVDEKQLWRAIRKELEDIGISVAAFNANKGFILAWFQEAISTGAFEERAIEDVSDGEFSEADLPSSLANFDITTTNSYTEEAVVNLDEKDTMRQEGESLEIEENPLQKFQEAAPESIKIQETPSQMLDHVTAKTKQDSTASKTQGMTLKSQSIRINHAMTAENTLPPDSYVKAGPRTSGVPQLAALMSRLLGRDKILLKAVKEGDLATFKAQVSENGLRFEFRDGFKIMLLGEAIWNNRKEMLFLLIQCVDIKANGWSETLLKNALPTADIEIVRLLLESGAYNQSELSLDTAIFNRKRLDFVALLVDHGASVNRCDTYKATPLSLAIEMEQNEIVEFLLKKGADPNETRSSYQTPLTMATKYGSVNIAALLLQYGADVNHRTNKGDSALAEAISEHQGSTIELLLDNGADPDQLTRSGESLLEVAISCSNVFAVKLLLDNGVNPTQVFVSGYTPLILAASDRKSNIMRLLLERGADIDFCTSSGYSALMAAVEHGHASAIELLLVNGVNPNQVFVSGDTPLIQAVRGRRHDVIPLLLQSGADINFCTSSGYSALMAAVENSDSSVTELLLVNGAVPERNKGDNKRLFRRAQYFLKDTTYKLLLEHIRSSEQKQSNGKSSS